MSRAAARIALSVFALVLLVPTSQGALTGTHAFETGAPYAPLSADDVALVSGALAASGQADGPVYVQNATYAITGLEQVCWEADDPEGGCVESAGLSIHVLPGSDTAFRFRGAFTLDVEATHALALFLDLAGDERLGDLGFNRSIAAPAIDATLTAHGIPPIPHINETHDRDAFADRSGGVAGASEESVLEVRDNGTVVHTARGEDTRLGFTGAPRLSTMAPDAFVVPAGLTATFTAAGQEAARRGLDLARVDRLRAEMAGTEAVEDARFGDIETLLQEVFDGAYLRTNASEGAALIRFTGLTATPGPAGVHLAGTARLDVRDGEVKGAQDLHGFWWIQLPWWGWLLWALAIGVLVTRIALKAPKTNERWDRFRWIGWVAVLPVLLLIFWLWDREIDAVFGTSILTTDASGTGMLVVLGLQLGTLALVATLLWWPVAILLHNGLMLARQGRFMNLGMPVALLIAFLLGATLLLSYLDLFLPQVIEGIG